MKVIDTKLIRMSLKNELDAKRFQHTLGVAYTAASLAMCYQLDVDEAFLTGLLHDCAKCMSNEERLDFCRKRNIPISLAESANPFLLHAKVGSFLAKEKYGVDNCSIQNAILYHTTGHPNMTFLEKIIYIADYIEPMRDHDSQLPNIRHLAFTDIDASLYMILENTLNFLSHSKQEIDPATKETYLYYKKGKGNLHE